MAEVKILIKGYTNAGSEEDDSNEKTCPTISLIKDKNLNIVSDPGILEDQNMILEKLKEEGLSKDDIDIVFITHSHLDHYRNIGMFPSAKTLEYWGLWDKNTVDDWDENFTEDIKLIKTPGHSTDSLTMLVKTKEGVVAICGDVLWSKNGPEVDEYAIDQEKLKESRKKVLSLADFIVPGHGDIFKSSL